jgi:CRISPR-associated protein Cmr5
MSNETTRQGIEQGRANYAYECALKAKTDKLNKEYKSYVKKLPMLIKTNGLGASFAFMFSKKNKEGGKYWNEIGKNIFDWLSTQRIIDSTKIKDFDSLVNQINQYNSTEYRRLTSEVISFLTWLRRFADGLFEGE